MISLELVKLGTVLQMCVADTENTRACMIYYPERVVFRVT